MFYVEAPLEGVKLFILLSIQHSIILNNTRPIRRNTNDQITKHLISSDELDIFCYLRGHVLMLQEDYFVKTTIVEPFPIN